MGQAKQKEQGCKNQEVSNYSGTIQEEAQICFELSGIPEDNPYEKETVAFDTWESAYNDADDFYWFE